MAPHDVSGLPYPHYTCVQTQSSHVLERRHMKLAKACRRCRIGKRRCEAAGPGLSCKPCTKRGLDCSLVVNLRRHLVSILPPPVSPLVSDADDEVELDLPTTLKLVRLYLDLVHNKPHTLFHTPSLLQAVEEGSLARHVLYAIFALIVRFAPDTYPGVQSKGDVYYERAKCGVKENLDTLSVENVQACLLIANYCGVEGLLDLESLYAGMACRTALVMRLGEPRPEDDDIQREVKLRTWWSVYMCDRWDSVGHQLPRQLPDRNSGRVPLPMDELRFVGLRPGTVSKDMELPRPGLWGRMVQLAEIFTRVQDLHRSHVQGQKSHEEAEKRTHELAADIDNWRLSLPPSLIPNAENMRQHALEGLGSVFVALHMGFYHYANLLYFPFLDLQLERTPTQTLFSGRCRQYAAEFSDLLALSNEIEGCEAVYFIVAHMTAVSSAALLHVLLFGQEEELPATRMRLEANFKTLVRLRGCWPAVEQLMERLFTFQRACMRSTDPNTHRADSWMTGFLLDHARPMAERFESPGVVDPTRPDMMQRDRVAADTLSLLRG